MNSNELTEWLVATKEFAGRDGPRLEPVAFGCWMLTGAESIHDFAKAILNFQEAPNEDQMNSLNNLLNSFESSETKGTMDQETQKALIMLEQRLHTRLDTLEEMLKQVVEKPTLSIGDYVQTEIRKESKPDV